MGLSGFAAMLFSILSLVAFMNAFPHRKKVNVPMLVIMFVMVGIVIYCDIYYGGPITAPSPAPRTPSIPPARTAISPRRQNMLRVHQVILTASALLVALLPVYTKLLRSINTNIEVEGNGGMGAIDISGEDA